MREEYPKEIILKDGRPVILRPLASTDYTLLKDFFQRIPEDDRWFLNHDIRDSSVPGRFVEQLDLDHVFPVIALDGEKMIADASLHRRTYGSRSHIGKIRVLVDPEYRNQRLGTWMILDLINLAIDFELEKIECRLVVGKEDRARDALKTMDFFEEARLSDYVRDREGRYHDLSIMIKTIRRRWADF